MRPFAVCLLVSASALAQEQSFPGAGAHFFIGPSLQLIYSGGPPRDGGLALALQGLVGTGQWMIGGELRIGVVRSPSLFIDLAGRFDRFLQSKGDSLVRAPAASLASVPARVRKRYDATFRARTRPSPNQVPSFNSTGTAERVRRDTKALAGGQACDCSSQQS
jgi:hypothetical protein